jgi:hypothetical protein
MKFSPKWGNEGFRAPFTASEGWGTYEYKISGGRQHHYISVKYGHLSLRSISLKSTGKATNVVVKQGRSTIEATFEQDNEAVLINLAGPANIKEEETLEVIIEHKI